jgi:hypothetical protein
MLAGQNYSDQIKYANIIGSPTWLFPPPGKLGTILLILHSYQRRPDTSLAEWVSLYNEWSWMHSMWGFSPLHFASIPAEYLPEGIDEGIYTIDERPYNPSTVIWLQRGDLVYSFGSTYHRPQEISLILAVIQSMEFNPTVEATLRASGGFQGDDERLRQQIADAQPEPTPECDLSCQQRNDYIAKVVAPAATAKALPPLERPTPVAYSPLPVGEDWITYAQPVLGISFRYPPGMSIVDPFRDQQLGDTEATRWGIALTPTQEDRDRIWTMVILPYLLGKDTPLANWEAMYDQLVRAGRQDDNFNFPYRTVTHIDPIYFPRQADDMIMINNGGILISVDHIVYQVGAASATLPLAGAILSTLEFDEAHLAKLRTLNIFRGDEQQIVAELVQAWATPTPPVVPVPTPTVRATVTPAAFESPLVNGLRQYHGNSNDEARSPYRLLFDPTLWQWVVNGEGENFLTHQQLVGCELFPGRGVYEVPPLAPVELAGQEWGIYYLMRENDVARALMYGVGWEGGYFQAILNLSEPLPDPYDPENKLQCQQAAEAVLDTFTYEVVSSTPTNTPVPIDLNTLLPTVTPAP